MSSTPMLSSAFPQSVESFGNAVFGKTQVSAFKLAEGNDKLAVINGLDGYIVAEEGGVLFICKKGDSSALVRKYVNKVQMEHGDEYV